MSASDPQSEKRRLRLEIRGRLAKETPQSARAAGLALADRIVRLEAWQRASRVGLFMSRPDEIATESLADRVLGAGKGLLVPRMTESRRLDFVPVSDLARLVPGPHGILEPPAEWPATAPVRGDVYCLPGLAFDRTGGRLGRGGGYYDRTFAAVRDDSHRACLLGIGFSFQLIAKVPMSEHDVRLDGVVTDREAVELESGDRDRAR